jgi:hypothetical protein
MILNDSKGFGNFGRTSEEIGVLFLESGFHVAFVLKIS